MFSYLLNDDMWASMSSRASPLVTYTVMTVGESCVITGMVSTPQDVTIKCQKLLVLSYCGAKKFQLR